MTAGAADPPRALRVLLWSPPGVGLHYSGPAMTAHRMYSRAAPGRFELSLVHGLEGHERSPLFVRQEFLAPSRRTPFSQWNFARMGRRWMERHAREHDVVHGIQGFLSTVAPCAAAQRLGVPAVVKFAMHNMELRRRRGLRALLEGDRRRAQVACLAACIAISSDIAQELRDFGVPEASIVQIPNGVDVDQFRPATEDERRAERERLGWRDEPTVLFVGAVCVRKRPHLLVEALGELRRRGVTAQLVLAGPEQEAEYVAQMRARAQALGVERQVVWAGFSPNVAPLYRAADLFALPSSAEGLPNAMLEAMASGLPAVGTRLSGIVDLIEDDRTGRLVAPAPGEIADALAPYLADLGLCRAHGANALRLVLEGFSVDAVLDAHERLFRAVIAGRPAAEASLGKARRTSLAGAPG